MFFMAPGMVFMIPGGFLSSFIVPGWFKSELRAAVRRWEHPKRYLFDLHLSPTIPLGLTGWLWPSVDDDHDPGDITRLYVFSPPHTHPPHEQETVEWGETAAHLQIRKTNTCFLKRPSLCLFAKEKSFFESSESHETKEHKLMFKG